MSPVDIRSCLAPHLPELLAFRRDLHAHPELSRKEFRTTRRVAERLQAAGLSPQLLPGTGLICDVGSATGRVIALRADLDALPITEDTGLAFASAVAGVSHACGHDVHASVLLGVGLVLADLARAGRLPGRVRLIFQAAEEVHPGGALDVVAAGGLDGIDRAYALHCDPRTDVGIISLRPGAITAAFDSLLIRLHGPGGHTSRPHLTGDVVFALAEIVTRTPGILSRRIDPRAGATLVWGRIVAGAASNVIPRVGEVEGSLRCLDAAVWAQAGNLVSEVVHDIVRPFGLRAEVLHTRGVPPTINDADAVQLAEAALAAEFGAGHVALAEQSLGGEDFAWMLEKVPGAMMRLGTRTPGGADYDLHRGDFQPDERALAVGVRCLLAVTLRELDLAGTP